LLDGQGDLCAGADFGKEGAVGEGDGPELRVEGRRDFWRRQREVVLLIYHCAESLGGQARNESRIVGP
jgi:hypothetical protein